MHYSVCQFHDSFTVQTFALANCRFFLFKQGLLECTISGGRLLIKADVQTHYHAHVIPHILALFSEKMSICIFS